MVLSERASTHFPKGQAHTFQGKLNETCHVKMSMLNSPGLDDENECLLAFDDGKLLLFNVIFPILTLMIR